MSNYINDKGMHYPVSNAIFKIPLFHGSNLDVYEVVGFLKIANQNWDIEDLISNAIFNNSSNNPHVYRVVGLLRLHREIGT